MKVGCVEFVPVTSGLGRFAPVETGSNVTRHDYLCENC